jgi:hypothetical protein
MDDPDLSQLDGSDSLSTIPHQESGEAFSCDFLVPKRQPTATCPSNGRLRPLATINSCDLFGMINGRDQILAFSFSGIWESLHSRFPGAKSPMDVDL